MDVLDNYKKAWDSQANNNSKVSKEEIFEMCHKKSSSIVKWIFIIGLIELLIFIVSYCFIDTTESTALINNLGIKNLITGIQILAVIIFFYFLFQFYKNWKNISVIDNTKGLMRKILKTRALVKLYIFFNLILITVVSLAIGLTSFLSAKEPISNQELIISLLAMLFFTLLLVGAIWGIYQLLYGVLLKKLNNNYKELITLDE